MVFFPLHIYPVDAVCKIVEKQISRFVSSVICMQAVLNYLFKYLGHYAFSDLILQKPKGRKGGIMHAKYVSQWTIVNIHYQH